MELLTTKAAAEIIGCRRDSLARCIRRGQLKAEKFGRDYLIRPEDLEAFKIMIENRPVGRPKKDAPESTK